MLEKWELVHSPSDKDQNRYRLKLKIEEHELPALLTELKVDSDSPFAAFSDGYSWGLYIYGLNETKIESLNNILAKKSGKTTQAPIPKPEPSAPAASNSAPNPNGSGFGTSSNSEKTEKEEFWELYLNPRYTFEEFVVGSNNMFTHAAALAVAENHGKVYNPLFIYGGVGLGKTHLMQAIGHYVGKKFPDLRIFYVTSEKFVSEVIDSVGRGTLQQFRDRYRQVDLLLVDDVQFLAESESTQDEFFHTFNILHQHNKQIVLTSDRPPKLLNTLADRLRSRFEWGLIADIKSPTLETRVAILKRKGEFEHVKLDDNMLLYVASKLKSDIRELEGFLKRINAYASITKQNVDMEMVKSLMKDLMPAEYMDEYLPPSPAPSEPAVPVIPVVPPPVFQHPVQAPVQQHVEVPVQAPSQPVSSQSVEGIDKTFRPVDVVFFYPEGKEQDLNKTKEKFRDVIKKHNLKFRLESIFDRMYNLQIKINYNMFTELCKTNKANIAIVVGPPPDSCISNDEFMTSISSFMESEKISLQYISWDELNKDYRYLNLALDITLTKHKDTAG
ncbi:MAG: chromosomal replication initiator protein DnaA [Elusimicrobia bacterium]|nr:chromosomal replication initiator protein DnaA [Elusimicrobiota bacterium]